jgi:hypothetical protein
MLEGSTMRRSAIGVVLILGLLWTSLTAEAQPPPKMPRIGLLTDGVSL